jgi:hypothetical protein
MHVMTLTMNYMSGWTCILAFIIHKYFYDSDDTCAQAFHMKNYLWYILMTSLFIV